MGNKNIMQKLEILWQEDWKLDLNVLQVEGPQLKYVEVHMKNVLL